MTYCNKTELRDLIEQYQNLSDDIDDSWLDKYKSIVPRRDMSEEALKKFKTNRENFRKWKREWYKAKKIRLGKETEAERIVRHFSLQDVETKLCNIVFRIIDGVLSTSSFFKVKADKDLMDDMRAEAIIVVWKYLNRFDIRKPNPFAYFTEVIKNSMNLSRKKEYSYRTNNISFSFLELFDTDTDNFGGENVLDKVPKFIVKDIQKEQEEITGAMSKFMEGGN